MERILNEVQRWLLIVACTAAAVIPWVAMHTGRIPATSGAVSFALLAFVFCVGAVLMNECIYREKRDQLDGLDYERQAEHDAQVRWERHFFGD